MSADLAKQSASYKAQLQQVKAALSGNGVDEDLPKLKKDMQEVIGLTKDLLSTRPSETLASSDSLACAQPTHSWKVGDRCMAIWSEEGQCCEAEIEELEEENGTAAVAFAGCGNAEVDIKPVEEGRKAREDSGYNPRPKKKGLPNSFFLLNCFLGLFGHLYNWLTLCFLSLNLNFIY